MAYKYETKNCKHCEYCVKTNNGLYCSHREGSPKVTSGGWCIDMQEKVNNDTIPVGTKAHINLEDIKWECNGGDLISRSELIKAIEPYRFAVCGFEGILSLIANAPAVEYTFEEAFQKTVCENKLYCPARPQSEWVRKVDVIQSIAKQYSDHNELVPMWLRISDIGGDTEE